MKKIFLQDWGPFHTDTLVVVGMSNKEIVRWLIRHANSKGIEHAIADFKVTGRPRPEEEAFVYNFEGKSIMWLGWDWKGGMDDLCNLVHETNHLLFNAVRSKGMIEECEAQAYMQEWLFQEISRKLGVKSNARGSSHDRSTTRRNNARLRRLQPTEERGTQASTQTKDHNDSRDLSPASGRNGHWRR